MVNGLTGSRESCIYVLNLRVQDTLHYSIKYSGFSFPKVMPASHSKVYSIALSDLGNRWRWQYKGLLPRNPMYISGDTIITSYAAYSMSDYLSEHGRLVSNGVPLYSSTISDLLPNSIYIADGREGRRVYLKKEEQPDLQYAFIGKDYSSLITPYLDDNNKIAYHSLNIGNKSKEKFNIGHNNDNGTEFGSILSKILYYDGKTAIYTKGDINTQYFIAENVHSDSPNIDLLYQTNQLNVHKPFNSVVIKHHTTGNYWLSTNDGLFEFGN